MPDVKEEVQQDPELEQEEVETEETPVEEEESSTAESNTETLRGLSPEEYTEWRRTGKLPERLEKPVSEKKPKPVESKKPVEKEEESEPSDEAEEEVPKKKPRSERRKDELTAEIQELNEKKNKEQKELDDIISKKKKAQEQEPEKKEEPEEKPKATDVKSLVAKIKARSEKGEFATYEEVMVAMAEELMEQKGSLSEAKLKKLLADSLEKFKADWVKEQEEKTKQSTVEAARKKQEDVWIAKVDQAEKKHPDFKDICFSKSSPAAKITRGSPLDRAILKAPLGAELLYHCCSTDGEIERIEALDPDLDQPAEIAAILKKLAGEKPKKKKAQVEVDNEEEDETEAPPPVTKAKKPPAETSGRNSAGGDATAKAIKDKDVGAYMRLENEKEMARRKAQASTK